MAEVSVTRVALPGMVVLKGDLSEPRLAAAVREATGQGVPAPLAAQTGPDGRAVLWMAPDEVLLILPEARAVAARIARALAGMPHLVADVSDARVAFRLTGTGARAVLARLVPADLTAPAFGPGMVRRSRLAQVACAIWMPEDGQIDVLVFRSVAAYAQAALQGAASSEAVAPLA
jgi:sarcosine oxidase subunit gamma